MRCVRLLLTNHDREICTIFLVFMLFHSLLLVLAFQFLTLTATPSVTIKTIALQGRTHDTCASIFTGHTFTSITIMVILADHHVQINCSLLFHNIFWERILGCSVELTGSSRWHEVDTETLRLNFARKCAALKSLVV